MEPIYFIKKCQYLFITEFKIKQEVRINTRSPSYEECKHYNMNPQDGMGYSLFHMFPLTFDFMDPIQMDLL